MTAAPQRSDPAAPGRIRQRNQELILAAAERVFAERGYAGASMAQIAKASGLPKPNLHYYFGTKEALYRAVLTGILELWLEETEAFTPEADPAATIAGYVRAKMRWSRERPHASKVFANELLHGAPFVGAYLATELRQRVERKSRVIAGWAAAGRIARLDGRHLFFALWAITQTYADFEPQVNAVLGVPRLSDEQFAQATEQVVALALRGCGLAAPG